MGGLPPLTDLLDPREEAEARDRPILGAVNIPCSKFGARSADLCSADQLLRVAATDDSGEEAVRRLSRSGRLVVLEREFCFGVSEQMRLWSPNPFFVESVSGLRPGRAVDLGCGSGRDSVALALLGWNVLGIDVLPDALERAALLADRHRVAAQFAWKAGDLEKAELLQERFDLAVIGFYLDRDLVRRLPGLVCSGGHILVETFSAEHRARFGKPRLGLEAGELPSLLQGVEILHYSEDWRESGRHTVRLFAKTYTSENGEN